MSESANPEPESRAVCRRDLFSKQMKSDRVQVPLRSGDTADLALTVAMVNILSSIQERHPRQFEGLVALYRGRPVAADVTRELANHGLLVREDGSLQPLTRAVLASSLLELPEGVVLREPVDLTSEVTRDAYRSQQELAAHNKQLLWQKNGDNT